MQGEADDPRATRSSRSDVIHVYKGVRDGFGDDETLVKCLGPLLLYARFVTLSPR